VPSECGPSNLVVLGLEDIKMGDNKKELSENSASIESINDEKQQFKIRIESDILKIYEEFDKEKSENPKVDLSQKRSLRIKQLIETMQEHDNQMLGKVEAELVKTKNDLKELQNKFFLRTCRKKKKPVCTPQSSKQTNKGERASWIKSVQCPECKKNFYKSTTMRIHFQKVHEKISHPHKCIGMDGISCSKVFKYSDGLKDHINIVHLGKRFECSFCDKNDFKRRSAVKHHVKARTTRILDGHTSQKYRDSSIKTVSVRTDF
jgi:hypothetical protein